MPFSTPVVPAVHPVRRRALGLLATLGVATLLAGCGGEPEVNAKPVAAKQAGGNQTEAAKNVVRQYLAALLAGDGGAACNLLTEKMVADVVDDGEERTAEESFAQCADAIGGLGELLEGEERKALENPKFTSADIDGNKAVLVVEPAATDVTLTHTDNEGWLIADGIDG